MTSHGQQQWYDMEVFDLEEALRLFCETTTRSFLFGMWNEHQRSKILEKRVAEQRQIINDRDMYIKELEERQGALEEALEFEQGSTMEQSDTIRELDKTVREQDTMLKRNAARDAQTISQLNTNVADRNEDIRKLKMQIIELEERNKRLSIISGLGGVKQ
jgi:uncharacterized coiled-coil protein SlyX